MHIYYEHDWALFVDSVCLHCLFTVFVDSVCLHFLFTLFTVLVTCDQIVDCKYLLLVYSTFKC